MTTPYTNVCLLKVYYVISYDLCKDTILGIISIATDWKCCKKVEIENSQLPSSCWFDFDRSDWVWLMIVSLCWSLYIPFRTFRRRRQSNDATITTSQQRRRRNVRVTKNGRRFFANFSSVSLSVCGLPPSCGFVSFLHFLSVCVGKCFVTLFSRRCCVRRVENVSPRLRQLWNTYVGSCHCPVAPSGPTILRSQVRIPIEHIMYVFLMFIG